MPAATPYSYGLRNLYRPTSLIPNAYGWSQRPSYNRADVPTGLSDRPSGMTDVEFQQQFAYEWYLSGQLDGNRNLSNPPFLSGAAGRLHPALRDSETGHRARILRGFIRRANTTAGDEMSKARLYFMYNPETITRDYVSYLNQSALDPFNSVYQSGNLVAPPSFMDFSFSLFFDRQEEAMQRKHPGVFVDYQFFDLVVRNVVPSDPNQSGNTLPDNGVMMVNPMDICVIFSPQLSVQGRPLNATVSFEKFTHRMTPTRMTIQLQMRVIYMGPPRDSVEYKAEELQAEAQIPMGEAISEFTGMSFEANDDQTSSWFRRMTDQAIGSAVGSVQATINRAFNTAGGANSQAREAALQWAKDNVVQGGPGDGPWTDYEGKDSGSKRYNLPNSADCSGLVTEAYIKTGNGQSMAWYDHPGTSVILQRARDHPERGMLAGLDTFNFQTDLQKGDILIREGHIVFFDYYDGNRIMIFDAAGSGGAPEVGSRMWGGRGGNTWYLLRPTPVASTSGLAGTSVWQDTNTGQHGAANPRIS
jgi:hypothetical protein